MLSLLADTGSPPLDIGLNYKVVDQRRKQVSEQNRQHHAFRECRVHNADHHHHKADQSTKEPLTFVGHGRRYRIGGHKDHTEGKTTQNQVPVPGHGKQRIGVRTNAVEQQRGGHHADHHTGNNTPGSNPHGQQYRTTEKKVQCAGYTHGTLTSTDNGVHPAGTTGNHVFNTAFVGFAQRGCTRETVGCRPHAVTGNIGRVSEEQEGTTGQCRVEEVFTGTTENFLTDHHTKGNTQSNLPQRNGRRQNQGKEYGSHEETFVHFVLTDGGKQDFPETTHNKGHGIHRQEVSGTKDNVVPDAGGTVTTTAQQGDQHFTPAFQHRAVASVDSQVGLQTDVVHTEKHRRKGTQPHGDHNALEVDTI